MFPGSWHLDQNWRLPSDKKLHSAIKWLCRWGRLWESNGFLELHNLRATVIVIVRGCYLWSQEIREVGSQGEEKVLFSVLIDKQELCNPFFLAQVLSKDTCDFTHTLSIVHRVKTGNGAFPPNVHSQNTVWLHVSLKSI